MHCIKRNCISPAPRGSIATAFILKRALSAEDVLLTADDVSMQGAMQQTDACGAVINVPKIAMLFLATKGFPHAAMWAMWFQQVRGLVPKDCVARAFCPGRGTKGDVAGFNELVQACGPTDETQGVQHLRILPLQPSPNRGFFEALRASHAQDWAQRASGGLHLSWRGACRPTCQLQGCLSLLMAWIYPQHYLLAGVQQHMIYLIHGVNLLRALSCDG